MEIIVSTDKKITFFIPSIKRYETSELKNSPDIPKFVPVSLTGKNCQLKCKHCGGHLLGWMRGVNNGDELISLAKSLYNKGCEGILISGGSDKNGQVPLKDYLAAIDEIKVRYDFKIAVHTGLIDKFATMELKKSRIDMVMIDIIGHNDTINNIYNLNSDVVAFENSLRFLEDTGIDISPHVLLGLDYGNIKGEYNALDIISRYKIYSLVLVIFTPIMGTVMGAHSPPPLKDVSKLLEYSRHLFCNKNLVLGCKIPSGEYRHEANKLAIDIGLNGIAYPSDGMVGYAESKGYKVDTSEWCCSFWTS